MALFGKKKEEYLSDEEYEKQLRSLEFEIEKQRKLNQLHVLKETLAAERSKPSASNAKFAKILSAIGEMGANVNRNLEKEDRAGRGFRVPDVSKDAPNIRFSNTDSLAPNLQHLNSTKKKK